MGGIMSKVDRWISLAEELGVHVNRKKIPISPPANYSLTTMYDKYEYENFFSAPEKTTWKDVLSGIGFIVVFPIFLYLLMVVLAPLQK